MAEGQGEATFHEHGQGFRRCTRQCMGALFSHFSCVCYFSFCSVFSDHTKQKKRFSALLCTSARGGIILHAAASPGTARGRNGTHPVSPRVPAPACFLGPGPPFPPALPSSGQSSLGAPGWKLGVCFHSEVPLSKMSSRLSLQGGGRGSGHGVWGHAQPHTVTQEPVQGQVALTPGRWGPLASLWR